MKKSKKWKGFEDSSHKIIKKLNPKVGVFKSVYIEGRLSKVKRQIDVKMEELNQYDFIAFECKDYKRPLDVSVVEKFNTTLQDIGAKKGAIVSNSPFSKAAQNMASELNIDLLHLIDTSNKNVRGRLYAGLLISDTMVNWCKVRVSISAPTRGTFPAEPKKMILEDESGNRGTAYEIFASLWNETDSSLSRKPGVYRYVPSDQDKKKIISLEGEVVPLNKLAFIYEVVEKHYLGKIEIIDAQGLYNVKEKSFQTKNIVTQRIAAYEFEKTAKEISAKEAEKAKGQYTFGLSCVSLFPEKQGS